MVDKMPAFDYPGLKPRPSPIEFQTGASWSDFATPFDEAVHLQLEAPDHVTELSTFRSVTFPYEPNEDTPFAGLAYTPPFRLLSDEGVRALRSIIEEHKPNHLKRNARNTTVRGLGYLSQFVRDFSYCPKVLQLLNDLCGVPIWPHDTTMNLAHTNVGLVGTGQAADQWHIDSVDYVCVVLVSDATNMVGGELQVLHGLPLGTREDLIIPPELVQSIKFLAAGYCIFLQGSKLWHSVNPVASAIEPRHSLVQPFTTRNVFAPDLTRLDTFRKCFHDPAHIAELEFARHRAWRVQGQMQYLIDNMPFGSGAKEIAKVLEGAAQELLNTRRLILGEVSDLPGFILRKDGDGSVENGDPVKYDIQIGEEKKSD